MDSIIKDNRGIKFRDKSSGFSNNGNSRKRLGLVEINPYSNQFSLDEVEEEGKEPKKNISKHRNTGGVKDALTFQSDHAHVTAKSLGAKNNSSTA